MKHIKLFEGFKKTIWADNIEYDTDYIEECFIDLDANVEMEYWSKNIKIHIHFNNEKFYEIKAKNPTNTDLSTYIELVNYSATILSEIHTCIEKIKIEYPIIKYKFTFSNMEFFSVTISMEGREI